MLQKTNIVYPLHISFVEFLILYLTSRREICIEISCKDVMLLGKQTNVFIPPHCTCFYEFVVNEIYVRFIDGFDGSKIS